ncbi:Fimbrial protein precursor [Pseudomonas savastanoi]|nr:Fimbrial protein precursor [Pseudomonas savastanoi]
MKKLSLTLAVLGVMGVGMAGNVSAANNGKMVFNGTLTNISCDVGPGTGVSSGTNPGEINVDLGNVSFSDIGVSSESRFETAAPIQLLVNCSAGADQLQHGQDAPYCP